MLHARRKLGLANPEFQEALARGTRAEGLLARFGKKSAAEAAFDRAATRMDDLAEKLVQTGNSGDARVLEAFADRLGRAGDLHAEGQRQAAFAMLHARNKPGLAKTEVQAALAKGRRAESLIETFETAGTAATRRPPVTARPLRPAQTNPRAFVMPGAGLDLSGLVRALDRVKAWLLGR